MVTGHCESPCRVFVTIRGKRKGNWYKIVERYLKILLDKITSVKHFLAGRKRSIEIREKCGKVE